MVEYIKINKLKVHPQNVRKNYTDIEELAESIKSQGILQNLTAVPNPDEEGTYLVVIGNRRLTAAIKAGLESVPCVIVDMDEKTQIATMLLENMQRNDLTVLEQSQGFQMMLDFGETEDTIAEKTGFSKTTIRHRLNIAKLDQKVLNKKEKDSSFQMTLGDLYALEQVADIKTRNKILREATNSRELIWKSQNAAKEAQRAKNTKVIVKMLSALGIKEAPENAQQELYSGKWDTIQEISLEKDVPKRIILKDKNEVFYLVSYRSIKILKKIVRGKKVLTPAEEKQKQKDKNKKIIKARLKDMSVNRKEFIENVISGKISALKNEDDVKGKVWITLTQLGACVSPTVLRSFFSGKNDYECTPEEKVEIQKQVDNLSFLHSMLVTMNEAMKNAGDIYDWQGLYRPNIGHALLLGYEVLNLYGWTFEQEEDRQILDGTHEYYEKNEK